MDDLLDGYAAEAGALVPAYEALATEDVLAPVLDLLPGAPCRVLDVGAGTGRDAAWLAARRHETVAVEPVRALREAGMRLHRAPRIAWRDDRLPRLDGLRAGGERFGLILLVGVWQHLPPEQHREAIGTLAALAAPRGRIAMSLRHGPGAPGRPCFPADADAAVRDAEAAGLGLLRRVECESIQPQNRAAGVTWTWLCFARNQDGRNDAERQFASIP